MPVTSQRSGLDERSALFPAELMAHTTDAFVASFDRFEEYVLRQALAVFRSTGLAEACAAEASVEEAVARAGLSPATAPVPARWILSMMAQAGWVVTTGPEDAARYRTRLPLPQRDPAEVRAEQAEHDPACLPAFDIAALAAQHYPAVLRGETTGEQALFGGDGILPWLKYFSNDNPIYALSNTVGAVAAARALAQAGGGSVLEIGAGLGSGADALLEELAERGQAGSVSRYHLTDVSPLFLKRAQRTLASHHPAVPVSASILDIDGPFTSEAGAGNGHALVYGVNVLHVARDLGATLRELRGALRRDGMLVMAECMRPFAGRAFHLELVFNLLGSFRDAVRVPGWRPNGGFLTPEQWRAALEANGFAGVEVYPDIATIRDHYPSFIAAAILARPA
jgi:SAM-dependent methyltransferase